MLQPAAPRSGAGAAACRRPQETAGRSVGSNLRRHHALIVGGPVLAMIGALILWARAPDPRPSAPQPPTAFSSTTPASPAASCLSGGGVAIGVGDDAWSVVIAHGAGTTYIVKAGTHLRNFGVQPKSGDKFCGEPGAVLDGGRSLASAFSGGATNVTLDSITVREYDPGWQGAAIQPQPRASGWVVRNVSA